MLTVKGVSAYPPLVIFFFFSVRFLEGWLLYHRSVCSGGGGGSWWENSRIDPEPVVIVAIDRLK